MFTSLKSYINKFFSYRKNFYILIAVLIILKLWMLLIPNHPFDFWSFINRSQRYLLYDISIFEQDNKGVFISTLYLLTYTLYSLGRVTFSFIELHNLVFLNLISKLPFLATDILTGIIIYKTAIYFKTNKYIAKQLFILYFINPINFYIYGIHGHYETFVSFSIACFIYCHITKKYILSSIFLALAFSIKYIPIIYLPLACFYIIRNGFKRDWRGLYKFIITFSIASILLFSNIFFLQEGGKVFENAINLSQTAEISNISTSVYTVNPLNIISSFTYLFTNKYVNNVDTPILFKLSNYGILIVVGILLILVGVKSIKILRNKSYHYNEKNFINDIFIFTTIFFIGIGNFQGHYLTWITTLIYLMMSFSYGGRKWLYALIFITSIFYLYASEDGILTTYSMIKLSEGVNFFADKSFSKFTGTTLIAALITLLIIIFSNYSNRYKGSQNSFFKDLIYIFIILWTPLIIVSSYATKQYIELGSNQPKDLTFAQNYSNIEGSYFDIFSLKEPSGTRNKYIFKNNGLINTNIIKISSRNLDNYKTSIIINNNLNQEFNKTYYREIQLNECSPKEIISKTYDEKSIITQAQETLYVPIDINIILLFENKCINQDTNYLTIPYKLETLGQENFKLFITNFKN